MTVPATPANLRLGAVAAILLAQAWPLTAQETRIMQAIFYDHHLDGPGTSRNFGNYRSGECGADNQDQYTRNMVKRTLAVDTLPDGSVWKRPEKNRDLAMDCNSGALDQWYDPSVAKSVSCRKLYFRKKGSTSSGSTIWEFEDIHFFPVDDAPGAQVYGNTKLHSLYGNVQSSPDGKDHNYNWTMAINATFTYRGGERFYFRGDDDLWVFINNKLALDLGGIHSPRLEGEVRIDEVATQLMLVKGETYDVDIFFAERKGAGSWVRIETTMDLIPVNLAGIALKDSQGQPVSTSRELGGVTQFCADPSWDKPGESWCRNYEAPAQPGGSVEVDWYLNGAKITSAPAECFSVDPSNPMFADGKQVLLRAVHPDGYTAQVTLTGTLDVLADSVFLIGNGRMEQIAVRFIANPDFLPSNWAVTFSTGGLTGGVSGADTPSRRDGYTLYYSLSDAQKGPVGTSYINAGVATFTKTEPGKTQQTASVPVVDRMSPVLLSARMESNTATSTLTLTLSEELNNVAELFEDHLSFKKAGGATYEMSLGTWTSKRESSRKEYTIIIPALASPRPQLLDSVSLSAANQFLRDLNGNAPQSRYVLIVGEVTVRPVAMRLRGTGRLDTVILELDQSATLLPAGYRVGFEFVGTRTLASTNGPRVSGTQLVFLFASGQTPAYRTFSAEGATGSLYHPFKDKPAETFAFPVFDEMGAVVDGGAPPNFAPVKAAGQSHTFTFRVSEELSAGADLSLADLEFHRAGTGATYTLDPGEVTITRNGPQDYTLLFVLNAATLPAPGDTLSLDATALDLAGNAAPWFPVPIGGDTIAANRVVDAAYFDRNADGRIDSAVLWFSNDLIYLPQGITLRNAGAVHAVDTAFDRLAFAQPGDSRTVTISLGEARNRLARDVTYVRDGWVKVGAQAFQGIAGDTDYPVRDSAAPVIVTAAYRPGPQDTSGRDTLDIQFSEEVSLVNGIGATPLSPFRLRHDTTIATFALEHIGGDRTSRLVFSVLSISDSISYPSLKGDSVWIRTDSRITDRAGNIQTDPDNVRRPLLVTPPPYRISISAVTPFSPGQLLPDYVRAQIDAPTATGTMIVVKETDAKLAEGALVMGGWVTVYDAVGNVVKARRGMTRGKSDGRYYYTWDGANMHNRLVGSGTYLAVVEVVDGFDGATTTTTRLAVKR